MRFVFKWECTTSWENFNQLNFLREEYTKCLMIINYFIVFKNVMSLRKYLIN